MDVLDTCSEEEAFLLLKLHTIPLRTYYERLDFDQISNSYCREQFRFDKIAILELCDKLNIPHRYVCPNKTVCTGLEGFLILLRRLTYPNRLLELEKEFGRSRTELSLIINTVLDDIHERFKTKLTNLNQSWINLDRFSQASSIRGSPFPNCWGFIDGTSLFICRPTDMQKSCFSGHKRQHCLKFQGVVTPCGVFAQMYGPIEGSRHDSFLLQESSLLDFLQREPFSNYVLYGDAAYPVTPQLMTPFRGDSEDEKAFNKTMSQLRQCVEWEFGKIKTLFSFLDFKKNLKLLLQPVAKYYIVGTLLANCHTCIYSSQTGLYYDCKPPSLAEYLTD